MRTMNDKVKSCYNENNFPFLFDSNSFQQVLDERKFYAVPSTNYLRHISGKGYEFLHESGCLNLPSSRTLRDYTYYNQTTIRFSAAILTAASCLMFWSDRILLKISKNWLPFYSMRCTSEKRWCTTSTLARFSACQISEMSQPLAQVSEI